MTLETGIIVTTLLAVLFILLIYRELSRLYEEVEYLHAREEMEIEMAFVAGAEYGRENDE